MADDAAAASMEDDYSVADDAAAASTEDDYSMPAESVAEGQKIKPFSKPHCCMFSLAARIG